MNAWTTAFAHPELTPLAEEGAVLTDGPLFFSGRLLNSAGFLSRAQYEEIVRLGNLIDGRYPKKQFILASIGRALDEVATHLELKHPENVYRVPINGMREMYPDGVMAELMGQPLIDWLTAAFPPAKALRGRDIVFLDYVRTGGTLTNTMEFARRIYEGQGVSPKIFGFGLADFPNDFPGRNDLHLESMNKYPGVATNARNLSIAKFKSYGFLDFQAGKQPQLGQFHAEYVEKMRLRMKEHRGKRWR